MKLNRFKTVLGMNRRNIDFIYPLNKRGHFPNVDDKLKCKELLSSMNIPVPATYHVVHDKKTLREWPIMMAKIDSAVIKPSKSYGGRGILVLQKEDNSYFCGDERFYIDDINFHILEILYGAFTREELNDTAFFEYKIDSTGIFPQFINDSIMGIPDVRIIYRFDKPIMAMLRLPTIESNGKSNLHQGGIGVGIEINTGKTQNGCYYHNVVETHPDSGETLKAIDIPHFGDMLSLGEKVAGIIGLNYIGVDFSIDRKLGPMILEVNARPGLDIQIANQTGLLAKLT